MSNHNPPTNGLDKRPHHINRKGRPKTFDALRELAQQIANETAIIGKGEPALIDDGVNKAHILTNAEAILRRWAGSDNPQLQRAFIEVAFGKVPENLNVNFEKPLEIIEVVKDAGDTDA